MKSEANMSSYFDPRLGNVEVGYNKEQNVLVRFVSNKRPKKEYKVTGVKDTESRNNWRAWLYLAPVLVLMSVFLIYPLIDTIFISFMSNFDYIKGTFDGFTFNNYGAILGLSSINGAYESRILEFALPNTFFLVFATVIPSILIALLISVALNSIKWFQKILQTIFFLPYVTNVIAVGMVFSVLFDSQGVFNFLFGTTGKQWIYGATRWDAMLPLCIYIIWSSLPFKILVFLSGLQGIDKQYYQAAKIDAAPRFKVLWRVTVPLLGPQILYIMVTSFIGAFKEYSSIVGLFNGPGTTTGTYELYTIVYYIYDNLNTHTSFAAAAAVLLFLIILVFTFLQMGISKKRVYY